LFDLLVLKTNRKTTNCSFYCFPDKLRYEFEMTKVLFAAISAIGFMFLVSCYSSKATTNAFKDWDKNGDGAIDHDEFVQNLLDKKLIRKMGISRDHAVQEEEIFRLFFLLWDSDNNGHIDSTEWEFGTRKFFVIYLISDNGGFNDWDLNGDRKIDEDEFRLSMTRADYLGGWNFRNDNTVSAGEFLERLFNLLDLDNSGKIDESEYQRAQSIFTITRQGQ
jgi:hypothetical protein